MGAAQLEGLFTGRPWVCSQVLARAVRSEGSPSKTAHARKAHSAQLPERPRPVAASFPRSGQSEGGRQADGPVPVLTWSPKPASTTSARACSAEVSHEVEATLKGRSRRLPLRWEARQTICGHMLKPVSLSQKAGRRGIKSL